MALYPTSAALTREYLLLLCDQAIVPFKKWMNRDTPSAQANVATARAYLLAGCDFRVRVKPEDATDHCVTDEETIWIEIFHNNFEEEPDWHTYYIPTEARISKVKGKDWY